MKNSKNTTTRTLLEGRIRRRRRVLKGALIFLEDGRSLRITLLATMTSGGMYLTNFSLSYINYTTRIVAKCSKVIPTMVMGALMQGRRYEKKDYFAAMTLVCGVCLFALGDRASLPQFQPKGVVMIVCALFIEAAAGNFEEKRLFNVSLPASHAEVVMHANIFGLIMTTLGMTLNGEIWVDSLHELPRRVRVPSDDRGLFRIHERVLHLAFHSTVRRDEYRDH